MGSGHSTTKAASAEEQKPETGTTLFGSWDKPVADAYALKQQVSKKRRVVVVKAADAAGAAAGSTFQMEAGAGVKPSGTKATSAKKGPGTEREREGFTSSANHLGCTDLSGLSIIWSKPSVLSVYHV